MRHTFHILAILVALSVTPAIADTTEGPTISAKIIVGPFDLQKKYRSMEGPYLKQELRVSDVLKAHNVTLPESFIKFVSNKPNQASTMNEQARALTISGKRPPGLKDTSNEKRELYWLKRVKLDVLDENNRLLPTAEFFCHLVVYVNKDYRNNVVFPQSEPVENERMIILTQGQTDFTFPKGFAVPVASDETWLISFQAANRTTNKHRRIKHQLTLSFIKDEQTTQPIKPLHWFMPYIAIPMESAPCHQPNSSATDCQLTAAGSRAPNAVGASVVCDRLGRKISSHWTVPPGTHTYSFPIALEPGLEDFAQKERKIHAVWSHIHPLCASTSLINRTTAHPHKIYSVKANTKSGNGLELTYIDTISSASGISLPEGHNYYMEATYVNNSGIPQDSMVGAGIFFADEKYRRPSWANKSKLSGRRP